MNFSRKFKKSIDLAERREELYQIVQQDVAKKKNKMA